MNRMIKAALLVFFAFVGLGSLSSCKKTEYIDYEKDPVNTIVEYKITNATTELFGTVDNVNNTINVYVPYFIGIDFLVPRVKLGEGAKLIDENDNEIDVREELEPIPFDGVGYKYRVKDNDGSIRVYTLLIETMPHKDPLVLGYATRWIDGVTLLLPDTTKKAYINSRFKIYGNFESVSRNVKLTLVEKSSNKVMPEAFRIVDMASAAVFYTLTVDVLPDVDPGIYYIIAEHQGRKDTLPEIEMEHRIPYFGPIPKSIKQGEEVTLTVRGPNSNGEVYSTSNPGIKKAHIILTKQRLQNYPQTLTDDMFDKPIELEIVRQTRTTFTFRFPESIPAGDYFSLSSYNSSSTTGYSINYAGLAIHFDFDYKDWGTGHLLAMGALIGQEIKAK